MDQPRSETVFNNEKFADSFMQVTLPIMRTLLLYYTHELCTS